jgi:hypothetical protein
MTDVSISEPPMSQQEAKDGGFALIEYQTPRFPINKAVISNTIPKANRDHGGMLGEVKSRTKVPGPEHYHKNLGTFYKGKGNSFGKLVRVFGVKPSKTPPIGHYDTAAATKVKIKGGIMNKTDRSCYFIDTLINQKKHNPAPDKYDGAGLSQRVKALKWDAPKNVSMKADFKGVGPGSYNPNFDTTEKRQPKYSTPRDPARSFLDSLVRRKDTPAPGHYPKYPPEAKGNPSFTSPELKATRIHDTQGQKKHMTKLLGDRIVTPRKASTAPSAVKCHL